MKTEHADFVRKFNKDHDPKSGRFVSGPKGPDGMSLHNPIVRDPTTGMGMAAARQWEEENTSPQALLRADLAPLAEHSVVNAGRFSGWSGFATWEQGQQHADKVAEIAAAHGYTLAESSNSHKSRYNRYENATHVVETRQLRDNPFVPPGVKAQPFYNVVENKPKTNKQYEIFDLDGPRQLRLRKTASAFHKFLSI